MRQQDAIYERFGLYRAVDPPATWARGRPTEFSSATRKAYNFTTENIAAYLDDLPLRGARVAAIVGSGDFPINAFLQGAAEIDAIDISPVACLFGELKLAGLQVFSWREFQEFFATTGRAIFADTAFSYVLYQPLQPFLSETARHYFDQLITPRGRHPYLAPDAMFISNVSNMNLVRSMNPYLASEQQYHTAQRQLRKIFFYPQRLDDYLAASTIPYDSINLSNIEVYPNTDFEHTVNLAKAALAPGGHLVYVGYDEKKLIGPDGSDTQYFDLERYGLPGVRKVTPDGYAEGSLFTTILKNPAPAPARPNWLAGLRQRFRSPGRRPG